MSGARSRFVGGLLTSIAIVLLVTLWIVAQPDGIAPDVDRRAIQVRAHERTQVMLGRP